MQIMDMLAQLHTILKCKVALLFDDNMYSYPSKDAVHMDMHNVEGLGSKCIFYTEEGAAIDKAALALALLHIKNQLCSQSNSRNAMINILAEEYGFSDIAVMDKFIGRGKEIYLVVVSGIDVSSMESELLEIIKNSVEVKHAAVYQGDIVVLVQEQNINEVCSNLQKNILTELFVETVIAIGGKIEQPRELKSLYDNCTEAMLLRQSFGINQRLLDNQSMLIYKLVASIDSSLKVDIVTKIFNSRFLELLNNEMELTIEEMFKNNLNLTDTSARLYIHRNTLLYRIDKIYKLTGFDLRKFEDSMIFKLAWLIYKERNKN